LKIWIPLPSKFPPVEFFPLLSFSRSSLSNGQVRAFLPALEDLVISSHFPFPFPCRPLVALTRRPIFPSHGKSASPLSTLLPSCGSQLPATGFPLCRQPRMSAAARWSFSFPQDTFFKCESSAFLPLRGLNDHFASGWSFPYRSTSPPSVPPLPPPLENLFQIFVTALMFFFIACTITPPSPVTWTIRSRFFRPAGKFSVRRPPFSLSFLLRSPPPLFYEENVSSPPLFDIRLHSYKHDRSPYFRVGSLFFP